MTDRVRVCEELWVPDNVDVRLGVRVRVGERVPEPVRDRDWVGEPLGDAVGAPERVDDCVCDALHAVLRATSSAAGKAPLKSPHI